MRQRFGVAVVCACCFAISGPVQALASPRSAETLFLAHQIERPVDVNDLQQALKANHNSIQFPVSGDHCEASASAFVSDLARLGDPETANDINADLQDPLYSADVVNFRNDCFEAIANLPPWAETIHLRDWVGTLKITGAANSFCTAFLVRPNMALTARHCLFDPTSGVQIVVPTQVEFVPADMGEAPASVVGVTLPSGIDVNNPNPITISDDYVFLSLNRLVSASVATLDAPSNGENLLVPGLFTYDGTSQNVYTEEPTCRVAAIVDTCLSHGCQTAPGFSGAPLISKKSDGTVVVIGIHLGSSHEGSCPAGDNGNGNIALSTRTITQ